MTDLVLAYIPCKDVAQAEEIGKKLLDARLCACINIYPDMRSTYFWPPGKNTFESAHEAVLVAKTVTSILAKLEEEVKKLHTYNCPCIIAIPVVHVNKEYGEWIKGELRNSSTS